MTSRTAIVLTATALAASACWAADEPAARGPSAVERDDVDTTTEAGSSEAGSPAADDDEQFEAIRARLDGPDRSLDPGEARALLDEGILWLRAAGEVPVDDGVPWDGGWADDVTTSDLRLLHSLLIVHDLVREGGSEDREVAVDHVRDWAAANPQEAPADPMAWHDETTARRATALVRLHDALEEADEQPDARSELEELLVDHLTLLSDDEFHSAGTNHGMFQDQALLLGARYLELRGGEADRAFTTGRERLLEYFQSSVGDDGYHREHAPHYHQLIANNARRDAAMFRTFGDDEAAATLEELHERMRDYATHVIQPDGTWPLVSDTFSRDQPDPGLWDDPTYRYAATGGAEGEAPGRVARIFPDGDVAVLRDRWTDDGSATYLHFTAAYHGSYHKHADDLSLWVYDDGPLLTEVGPQGYTMSDPLVACAFSELAHNTVTIVGRELPRTDDRTDAVGIDRWDLDGPVWQVTATNDRLDGTTIERTVAFEPEERVITVVDEVTNDRPLPVRIRWHLDPSVELDGEGVSWTLSRDERGDVAASFDADVPLAAQVLRDDPEACAGIRLGAGTDPEPSTTLQLRTEPTRTATIEHRFELPAR